MSFLGALGGSSSGTSIGGSLIRIGASASGLRGQVRSAVNDVKSELRSGTAGIEREGSKWNAVFKAGALALTGVAVAGAAAVGWATKVAMDYETAFAGVRKTVDATEPQLRGLSDQFRAMSREIPVSAVEFAALGEAAGALGIPIESIKEFARVTALLGVTTNVASADAATALGTLSNVLHLTRDDYSRFASTLVDLGNKGASTEQQILQIAERSGGAAALINLSAKSTLAFASSVASLGIEVEAGGSSLQNFYLKISKAVASGSTLKSLADLAGVSVKKFGQIAGQTGGVEKLARAAGVTVETIKAALKAGEGLDRIAELTGTTAGAFEKLFATHPEQALLNLIEGIGKLDAGARQAALADLGFNDIRITRTLLGLTGNVKLLKTNLDNADAAWAANNALQNEATKRFETTASKIQILKNRLTDIAITAGSAVLPGLADVVTMLSDRLPAALKIVGQVWDTVLAPALGRMLDGFGHLAAAVGGVFGSGDASTTNAERFTSILTGVASAVGAVARALGTAADVLAAVLSVGPVKELARVGAILVAVAAALGASRAAVRGLRGLSGGIIGSLTGGRLGTSGGTPDASSSTQAKAAAQQEIAAKTQMAAADTMLAAARGGVPGGRPGQYGPPLNFDPIQGPSSPMMDAAARAAVNAKAAQMAGRNIAQRTAWALWDGVSSAASRGKDLLKGVAGGAARLFWPAMIASIGLSLAQGPIGDLVMANTQFKRAGARIKEDMIGGLVDLATSWARGSDLFLALKRAQLGTVGVDVSALRGVNLTDAEIAALTSGGLSGAVAQQELSPALLAGLKRSTKEGVVAWYSRVIKTLDENGIDSSAVRAAFAGVSTRFNAPGSTMNRAQYEAEIERAAGAALSGVVDRLLERTVTSTNNGVNTAVVAALKEWSGGRLKLADIVSLDQAQYDELGRLMLLNAAGAIDPRVLKLTISGLLSKPDLLPPPPASQDIEVRRGQRGADSGAVGQSRKAIADAQAQLDKFLGSLTPDQESARQYALKVLDGITTGIEAAGKDKGKRKALLAQINKALDLTGADKMTWADLIDFQAQLGESTGASAQKQLTARLKQWAVQAAREGAAGGATTFWGLWGPEVEKASAAGGAGGAKVRAALLKSINSNLPKKEQFKSWKALHAWFEEQVATAGKAADAQVIAGLNLIAAAIGGFTLPTIKPPDMSDEDWAILQGLVKRGLITNVGTVVEGYVPPPIKPPKITPPVLSEKDKADLRRAGGNAMAQYAAGFAARVGSAMGAAIKSILHLFPLNSPAKEGPFAGAAWRALYVAGGNMAGEVARGYERGIKGMKVPAPGMPAAQLAAAGAGAGGVDQHLSFGNVNILGPADERSILRRVRFMARA